MVSNSGIVRNYHISDGDLALFANSLTTAMTRDLTQQAVYGITSTSLDDFNDLIDEFQELPNDEILRNDLSYAVELREASKKLILNTMRSISLRAKAVFGTNTSKYRSMSPGNISQMFDSNLLVAASQVHKSALSNVAQLTAEGITPLFLTTFNSDIEAFETTIKSVSDKKLLRDDGTEAKILKGNELYALIVKYCDYGKLLWTNVSPAKYNDYIIYDSFSAGSITAPENLTVDVSTMIFSWDPVENATSYVLEASVEVGSPEFEVIYSGPDNYVNYIPNSEGIRNYRIRCRNAGGYSDYSNLMVYNYHEPVLAPPQNVAVAITSVPLGTLELTWDAVEGATHYKIYTCKVDFGLAALPLINFTNAGTVNVTSFEGLSEVYKRQYYFVKSISADLESEASAVVWVER